jgi:hypothetical protein
VNWWFFSLLNHPDTLLARARRKVWSSGTISIGSSGPCYISPAVVALRLGMRSRGFLVVLFGVDPGGRGFAFPASLLANAFAALLGPRQGPLTQAGSVGPSVGTWGPGFSPSLHSTKPPAPLPPLHEPSRCGPSTTRGHPCPRTPHPCSGFSRFAGLRCASIKEHRNRGSRSAPVEERPRNAEREGTSDSRLAAQSRNRMRTARTEKRRSWWRVRSSRVAGRAPGAVPATPTDRLTTRTLTVTRTVAHSFKSLLGCVPTEPNSAHRAPPSYTAAGEGTTPGPSA